ncbi:hypothetical protein K469DRAFT_675686 [Zopfia rhizophila CBS 207.26]|uniref:Uncharacterized protein n=1 Tax=Zopfia rhizophila CBS 207.26 TaxID=1314779 RepID=A0A6A6DIA0_9PEZI|nr:hypothetical protein K469DRAFT_675686 [Zopfia rhizophila CBS 207.26]
MVRTRAQSREEAGGAPAKRSPPKKPPTGKRAKTADKQSSRFPKASEHTPKKRKLPEGDNTKNLNELKAPSPKRLSSSRSSKPKQADPAATSVNPLVSKLLSSYESVPLSDLDLSEPLEPTSSTALAHIINSLLSSTPISHGIAAKTLSCVVAAGYCDLPTLRKTTWKERTEVLTEGGYTHYREKTSTAFGDIRELVDNKYEGNAARLISGDDSEAHLEGEKKRNAVSSRLKQIQGIGPLGSELFMETAQAVWTSLAPFISGRNLKMLRQIGVEENVEDIYKSLSNDARSMARLCAAVTRLRLEGKEAGFS